MRVTDKSGDVTDYARITGKSVVNEFNQIRQHLYWPNGNGSFTLGWCEPQCDGSYELITIVGIYSTRTACCNAGVAI
jgi:hypothetical protein